jgi:membrane protease YdiL (CAAX protease family)
VVLLTNHQQGNMSCLGLGRQVRKDSVEISDRLRAGGEVALLFLFILLLAWSLPTIPQPLRFYLATAVLTWVFGLMIMSHLTYGETLDDLGLGKRGLRRSIRELMLPVGIIALFLLGLGLWLGTIHLRRKFFLQLAGIPFWALFQQYAAQSFINRRLQIALGPGKKSAIGTALLFAAAHLPNPTLTIATAGAGYIWARVFQRSPSLYAIALSHGLLSTLFANAMPKYILPNMVVGYNYLIK